MSGIWNLLQQIILVWGLHFVKGQKWQD